jgi:NAD dependent epimerase/dehydratase family enzyme
MSWIALDDAVSGLLFMLDQPALRGPVNLTAPEPVTNAAFTRAVGRALHRPTALPVPGFAAKLAFGEMAQVALLSGQRVLPKRLLDAGFAFAHPELTSFLAGLLR